MKCQRCPKQACYQITEILGPEQVEFLHLCEDCAKKHLYEPAPAPKKPGEQMRSCIANDRAREVFGWKPEVGLAEGLRQTIEFFRGVKQQKVRQTA